LNKPEQVAQHQIITQAVHHEGSKICLQILHTGRYAYNPKLVAPSALQAPINRFVPHALTSAEIEQQIQDFVHCAALAQQANYDGVEIMGSEGYFLNEFIAKRTNHRTDEWGGTYENRIRFPIEVVRRVREKVGNHFIIIFRLSMLDLVEQGSTLEEIIQLGQAIEQAGATLINTGIGWHEARIPTIATKVPRAAFTWATHKVRQSLKIPVITSNRINMPAVAEAVLMRGDADMVSMARPFLADPEFMLKADHVVGAGPAGLAFAVTAAQRGHQVTLYDTHKEIGGQFNLAKQIPGKEEFNETLRYFKYQLEKHGVSLRLGQLVTAAELETTDAEEIILATGINPRVPAIPGIEHPKVLLYTEMIKGAKVGQKVALIGAGGIGFDVAELLTHDQDDSSSNIRSFMDKWGVDMSMQQPGCVHPELEPAPSERTIYLLQRKTTKVGDGLGKTTGWIHRADLKRKGVHMLSGCDYQKIDDKGLHLSINGQAQLLEVDTIVICAGQEPCRELQAELTKPTHLIGGADVAAELDAKRAIDQGTRLAAMI
jgi:2,4-dienoyl-CoA reductase (NADPH2)